MDVRELRKITEGFAEELAQYIIDAFIDYGLDFKFEPYSELSHKEVPVFKSSPITYEVLTLNLWGSILPDDVTKSDEEVLEKFLSKIFDDFIESYEYKELAVCIKKTKFYCYISTASKDLHPISLNCEIELFYD